jgi:hypothetical protein
MATFNFVVRCIALCRLLNRSATKKLDAKPRESFRRCGCMTFAIAVRGGPSVVPECAY